MRAEDGAFAVADKRAVVPIIELLTLKVLHGAAICTAFKLVTEVVEQVGQVALLVILAIHFLLFVPLRDEVRKGVLLRVSLVNCSRLEIVYRNNPPITDLRRFAAQPHIPLAFLLSFLIVVHGDADHERGSLVVRLLRFDDLVDERQLDHAHVLVLLELLLIIVVPLEIELSQRADALLDLLVN